MVRFKSDQNKVLIAYESGTYGVTSGNAYWVGQVTDASIEEAQNLLVNRYLGTASRNYGMIAQGPRDITGTITYHPSDMKLVFFAIGSVASSQSAKTGKHTATEIGTSNWLNPFARGTGALNGPVSFTIEDSKSQPIADKNSIRRVKGAVINTATLTATQGEKVTVEIGYNAQDCVYTSGNTGFGVVNNILSGVTPYLWNNCSLTLAGSTIPTAKEISLEINNNIESPHYLNGSRVASTPFVGNKDYNLSITMDADAEVTNFMYGIYQANTAFNGTFDLNADVATTGSKHTTFILSGCKINTFELPSPSEGINESTLEILPQSISATEYSIGSSYTPW